MAKSRQANDLAYATARELASALRSRGVSATEAVEASIARIEARDGELNAVVVRDFDRARDEAREADEALARGDGRPLLGVPVTVKEAHDVAGLPTTWGIPGTETIQARADSVAVGRLREAGAIVLGKTNVPPMLADWQTHNPLYGVTNNPWNPARTPGGSSGGGAAALAAGFVALELGSDLAGSLRGPAHCCGVFGHKPSYGLVPMRGFAPPGAPRLSVDAKIDLAVIGPMARSAGDLELALDVLAGPDEDAATAYRLALPPPRHETLRGFRVLVLDRHPLLPTAASVRSAVAELAQKLERSGARVGRESPLLPDLAFVAETWGDLVMAFVGGEIPDEDYDQARAAAAALPVGDRSGGAASFRAQVMSHREWIRLDRARTGIADRWRHFFREWDVVVCPSMPTPAFPHDHAEMSSRTLAVDGEAIPYVDQGRWASLATLTGLPATAFPIGRSDDGLPIGAQAVGPFLEDRTPIAFAGLVEREFGGFVPPPRFRAPTVDRGHGRPSSG